MPDGRIVTQKDPELPAILQDVFIIDGLAHSRQARHDFCRLFPDLDSRSQERLTDMILRNKRGTSLILSEQAFLDAIQKAAVTSGVRTRLERAIRT